MTYVKQRIPKGTQNVYVSRNLGGCIARPLSWRTEVIQDGGVDTFSEYASDLAHY